MYENPLYFPVEVLCEINLWSRWLWESHACYHLKHSFHTKYIFVIIFIEASCKRQVTDNRWSEISWIHQIWFSRTLLFINSHIFSYRDITLCNFLFHLKAKCWKQILLKQKYINKVYISSFDRVLGFISLLWGKRILLQETKYSKTFKEPSNERFVHNNWWWLSIKLYCIIFQ